VKKFRDYFEAPIPAGELYHATKKSDSKLAGKLAKRITGKEVKRDGKKDLVFKALQEEFLGALEDIKEDLVLAVKNLDPKKIPVSLGDEEAILDLNKVLPKKFIKLYENLIEDNNDIQYSKRIEIIEYVTNVELEKSFKLEYADPKQEKFVNDLFKKAKKFFNLSSFDSKRLDGIYFEVETTANRVHFPLGLPEILKSMGIGKKCYLAVAYKLKAIASRKDASEDAKTVWASMMTTQKDFYAFYNSRTTVRFIMLKTMSNNAKIKYLKTTLGSIGTEYDKDAIIRKTVTKMLVDQFSPGSQFKRLDELFVKLSKELSETEYAAKKIQINKYTNKIKKKLDGVDADYVYSSKDTIFTSFKKVLTEIILKDSIMDKELRDLIVSKFIGTKTETQSDKD